MAMFICFSLLGLWISWKRRIPFPFSVFLGFMFGGVLSAAFVLSLFILHPSWAYHDLTAKAARVNLLEPPFCKDKVCHLVFDTVEGRSDVWKNITDICIIKGKPVEPVSINAEVASSKKVLLADISTLLKGRGSELIIATVYMKTRTNSLWIFPPFVPLVWEGVFLSLPEDLYKKVMRES